jgi:hypothetical protein
MMSNPSSYLLGGGLATIRSLISARTISCNRMKNATIFFSFSESLAPLCSAMCWEQIRAIYLESFLHWRNSSAQFLNSSATFMISYHQMRDAAKV